MSLKVLGKWARWSPSLHRHWNGVNQSLHIGGTVKAPSVKSGMKYGRTGGVKLNGSSKASVDGRDVDMDTDDEAEDMGEEGRNTKASVDGGKDVKSKDRSMHLARVFTRRWMKATGIERHQAGVEEAEHDGDWSLPHWTQGIAPRLEGRIVNVRENVKDS